MLIKIFLFNFVSSIIKQIKIMNKQQFDTDFINEILQSIITTENKCNNGKKDNVFRIGQYNYYLNFYFENNWITSKQKATWKIPNKLLNLKSYPFKNI